MEIAVSAMHNQVVGLCPSCEASGLVGAPCRERICVRHGVCCVPAAEAKMALRTPPSQREPLVGQFVGDYLVVSPLGKGGFGKVLLGLQRPMYRLRAAIKLLAMDDNADARMAQRMAEKFESEAAALAVLQHPNIVRLLQYGTYQQRAFIAMEYVPGARTLQTEINRFVVSRTALDPDSVKHVLLQVLNGLEAAHDQDIIHRDIKPENVMLQAVVGDSWHVKLVDFGLAKVVSGSRDTSVVLGTVHYMAPEQVEAKNLGPWTDLYAVAAIAFELMTGHRAFAGKEVQEILRQKLNAYYDPFARIQPHDLPPLIVDFLRKGLARHPHDRFQSTMQMRDALKGMFAAAPLTMQFSRDLSPLVDSADLAELRDEERRINEARRALEEDRKQLAAERLQLDSERLRISSTRAGRPSDIESFAYGPTAALPRSRLLHELDGGVLDTGVPATSVPITPVESKRRRGRWGLLTALVVLVGAIIVAIASLGGTEPVTELGVIPTTDASIQVGATNSSDQANSTPTPAVEAPPPQPSLIAVEASSPTEPVIAKSMLEIVSTPSNAALIVDGKRVGNTPYKLQTELGARHELELEVVGYQRASRDVETTVERERIEVVLAAMVPKPRAGRPVVSTQAPQDVEPISHPKPSPESKPEPATKPFKPTYIDD